MLASNRKFLHLFSIMVILAMLFSSFQPNSVQAQGGDDIKRQVNAESGRVSFLGPANGRSLSAAKALGTSARPQDPAMALAQRFAPEFGLQNPERNLSEMKTEHRDNGRWTVRYQQKYQGIPIMGGELIVNTNERGDLYSMNGEVSPNLSLSTQPTIDSAQARETALKAVAKWYEQAAEDFVTTEPELWVYDENLLRSSDRPVELVWRMEVTPIETGLPVRELVLVNAQMGGISLHFNQIDTAWSAFARQDDAVPATPTETLLPTDIPDSMATPVLSLDEHSTSAAPSADDDLTGQAVIWYVATSGSDDYDCLNSLTPCETINGTINKASTGDIIKVAIGTYTGTGTEVVLINKNVTLSGGWDASFITQSGTSTIDGQGARRGIRIPYSYPDLIVTTVVERFTIQNGLSVDDHWGGGVLNAWGTLTLNDSVVVNNASSWMGGGIFNSGTLTINNSTISGNTAGDVGHSGGGGGGGIENYQGSLILNNSTVSDNMILGSFSGSGIDAHGTVILNNSTVSGNTGGDGTGIYTFGGTVILNNSTISFNRSYGFFNQAGNITLRNSIIAMNGSGKDCYNDMSYSGVVNSQGYNLIGNGTICTFTAVTGDKVGLDAYPINPRLGPLQNNGASTLTHALMEGSPAIDSGNPATPGSGGNACLGVDQRGVIRPVTARCDIGAYEGSVPGVPSPLVSTYTANGSFSVPGYFLCNQIDPNCTAGDIHAKSAHTNAIGTYNFYFAKHNRDSIDNNGMAIASTVHYCAPDPYYQYSICPYDNAYWSGMQMVYGDAHGWPLADEVVAHELTHGVTQYESNLFYYYQSGAINESFSDLWGEYYDQTNDLGNDAADVKWRIGEDIGDWINPAPFPALGLRDMRDPTLFDDPDHMSSPNYYFDAWDNGGVHYNSGINNKAVYLMVDGGSFNSKTVTSLGWEKVGAIYYEAQTNLLTSGADYSDLYYTLQQACSNLIGQKSITSADCTEVKAALDAVEMNGLLPGNFNSDAPVCTTPGTAPNIVFADSIENGTSNWTFNNGASMRWQVDSTLYGPYAQSGLHSLYAADSPAAIADVTATLKAVVVPANAYLHFAQAYEFEQSDANYDGGVLEYSTNGGASWLDAGPLIAHNGYNGTIYTSPTGSNNPLSGRSAFVGASHGYISTRLNLSSLAGQAVSFRWRMGLDPYVAYGGWWVDNIKVYKCSVPTIFADVFADYWAWPYIERLYNAGVTGGCNANPLRYCPANRVTRDQMAVFLLKGKHGSGFVPPTPTGAFIDVPTNYWAAAWIEQLAAEGITAGCGGGKYCPATPVTRDQMAVFLLKAKHGSDYVPPTPTGVFADVPITHWAAAWIEQLSAEGITAGCGGGNYCPTTPVTRDQMAVFLVKNFNLP